MFATIGRLGLAALIAAVPAGLVLVALNLASGSGKLASVVQLVAGGVIFIGGYVIAALLLRVHEVRELTSMVRARLGR